MHRLTAAGTALLALALFGSATGGAVAGSLITGKQIQDGSVTGKDVKDHSLQTADLAATTRTELTGPAGPAGTSGVDGTPGVSGLEFATVRQNDIASGAEGSLTGTCPGTKKAFGAAAFWGDSSNPVQLAFNAGGASVVAYYDNDTGDVDDLVVQLRCALAP